MIKESWTCNRCGRVNAYWLPHCSCKEVVYTQSNTTSTPITEQVSRINIEIWCTHCGQPFTTSADGDAIIRCPNCGETMGKRDKSTVSKTESVEGKNEA